MNYESLEEYILSKKAALKEFPFGEDVAVYKVMNKMFALLSYDEQTLNINLKSDPDDAIAFRDIYESVKPGYHMNKKHWNTVSIDGSIEDAVLKGMIDESYRLVTEKLTKKEKEKLLLL